MTLRNSIDVEGTNKQIIDNENIKTKQNKTNGKNEIKKGALTWKLFAWSLCLGFSSQLNLDNFNAHNL